MKLVLYLILSLTLILTSAYIASAQPGDEFKSIHQVESEKYSDVEPGFQKDFHLNNDRMLSETELGKEALGYHAFWAPADFYMKYDYSALTTIAYFSYEVDPETGGYTTIRGWDETPLIEYAHQRGVNVVLTVTNFGYDNNAAVLKDPAKREKLIETVTQLVQERGGDGVNIDFEAVYGEYRDELVDFFSELSGYMRQRLPDAEISLALPAVDWRDAFDAAAIAENCDYLMIMGYDYYWKNSANAGPVAPLEGGSFNVTNSVNYYLEQGVPPEKLLLGVPWFGYDWPVEDESKKSRTLAPGTARIYPAMEDLAEANGKNFDSEAKVPWFNYHDGDMQHQAWYDDSLSLALKYDFVNDIDIGGIGIWALHYLGERTHLWDGIRQAFAEPSIVNSGAIDNTDLRIVPNPASSKAFIMMPESDFGKKIISIDIFDVYGNGNSVDKNLFAGSRIEIDCSGLASGYYSVILTIKNNNYAGKLLIVE